MADYFLNNQIIRNKLYLHYRATKPEYFYFTGLYSLNTMLYAYIGLVNGTIKDHELDEVFQSFGHLPLTERKCNNIDPTNVSSYLSTYMHLFYNASSDTVEISRLANDLSIIESFEVVPNGYYIFGNRPGRLFELKQNDSCIRYIARRNGYLILPDDSITQTKSDTIP